MVFVNAYVHIFGIGPRNLPDSSTKDTNDNVGNESSIEINSEMDSSSGPSVKMLTKMETARRQLGNTNSNFEKVFLQQDGFVLFGIITHINMEMTL